MLKISNVKVKINEKDYAGVVSSILNIPKRDLENVEIVKQSLDARHKHDLHYVCSFIFSTNYEDRIIKDNKKKAISKYTKYEYPPLKANNKKIVIVGSGPAGLFCAYNLVRANQPVILVEQGKKVEERVNDINNFNKTGKLNNNSNIQFGEGGAGTFSDGKLTTGIKDKRIPFVLDTFYKFGANKDITYLNKPHIGTDVLIKVIKNMRDYILSNGGEIRYNTKLTDIIIKDNKADKVCLNNDEIIDVDQLVLAIGHSARDTYEMLYNKGLKMNQKAFAVGFRIEHLQKFINLQQYGNSSKTRLLPAADYKLAVKTTNRGVYTFCMCPGGYVVNASSEENGVCVNGMSNYLRNNENSNSAILVTINTDDFNSDHPLAGVSFQRDLEHKAFVLGGKDYSVPIQRVEDYLNNCLTLEPDKVKPTINRYKLANLNELFNDDINNSLKEGLNLMNNKINGFTQDAILSGVEARSSAPVRIVRNEEFKCNIDNIYPIGEGAGYAGGIMSSAIDGLKCSEALLKNS